MSNTDIAPSPRPRHDGWTIERQRIFLEILADTGSVKSACHASGMTRSAAYRFRSRPEGAAFDAAWEAASRTIGQQLHDEALDRALNGVVVPVWYKGEMVGEERRYSERLLTHLMAQHPAVEPPRPAAAWDDEPVFLPDPHQDFDHAIDCLEDPADFDREDYEAGLAAIAAEKRAAEKAYAEAACEDWPSLRECAGPAAGEASVN